MRTFKSKTTINDENQVLSNQIKGKSHTSSGAPIVPKHNTFKQQAKGGSVHVSSQYREALTDVTAQENLHYQYGGHKQSHSQSRSLHQPSSSQGTNKIAIFNQQQVNIHQYKKPRLERSSLNPENDEDKENIPYQDIIDTNEEEGDFKHAEFEHDEDAMRINFDISRDDQYDEDASLIEHPGKQVISNSDSVEDIEISQRVIHHLDSDEQEQQHEDEDAVEEHNHDDDELDNYEQPLRSPFNTHIPMQPLWNASIISEMRRIVHKYSRDTLDEEDEDTYDPAMVAEYAPEIFNYLHELENKLAPDANYMDNQDELKWEMRSVLIDWVVQVHSRFNLLSETLFLTVNYIDRFLSKRKVSLSRFQLVGAVALFIAAKYEEINCPTIQEVAYMADNAYSIEDFLKAERFMIDVLEFDMGWPGPMSFLRRTSKADDYDYETRTLANLRTQLSKRLAANTVRSIRSPVIAALPKIVASKTLIRSFSNTQIFSKQASSEASLKSVIDSELKVSEEIPNELDAGFEEYLSSQGYKVITKDGNANVELIRTDASGHVIHVYFDVEEITDLSEEFQPGENEWANEDEEGDDFAANGFFSKFKVFIEDPATNDGLNFDLLLKNIETGFSVESANYQPNASEFVNEIAKGNLNDKFRYEGPRFEDLDESLQVEFENYLIAKGVNDQLAEFIVAYSEHKEESEYRAWLASISKFLK
ncbi:G2/mitotic-specific cyclin-4 [Spathaspora sp. JA1]|nr:G2/mitotic-specific cyclin-4 [Spathaspora sp. JA1]